MATAGGEPESGASLYSGPGWGSQMGEERVTWDQRGQEPGEAMGSCQVSCMMQMRARDVGWATFDAKSRNYSCSKKEWWIYRQTYHSMIEDNPVAKTLRERCVNNKLRKIMGNIEDLSKVWSTMDMCYRRSEKYILEALKPVTKFRKYNVSDSAAIREFYSLLLGNYQDSQKAAH
jgi:hypothetical protein